MGFNMLWPVADMNRRREQKINAGPGMIAAAAGKNEDDEDDDDGDEED
jgi:hypothetical protein